MNDKNRAFYPSPSFWLVVTIACSACYWNLQIEKDNNFSYYTLLSQKDKLQSHFVSCVVFISRLVCIEPLQKPLRQRACPSTEDKKIEGNYE